MDLHNLVTERWIGHSVLTNLVHGGMPNKQLPMAGWFSRRCPLNGSVENRFVLAYFDTDGKYLFSTDEIAGNQHNLLQPPSLPLQVDCTTRQRFCPCHDPGTGAPNHAVGVRPARQAGTDPGISTLKQTLFAWRTTKCSFAQRRLACAS
ncbi:MAG: hypothetical protein R2788_05425 [Saprospiraceae bacterium]